MDAIAAVRRMSARRPWIRWCVVVALAGLVATGVHGRLQDVDAARAAWGTTHRVAVARTDHGPGDPLDVEMVDVPDAVTPAGAVTELDAGSRSRQAIAAGEIVTMQDVATGSGPGSLARDGMVVVPMVDRFGVAVAGANVRVVADGVVLATTARVVTVTGDVALVEVLAANAPMVAASARDEAAVLVYVP